MKLNRRKALWAVPAAALSLTLLSACGGNLGTPSSEEAAAKFPDGPVNLTIGQDPGGSTDLIGRALADPVSDKLGVPVPVMNRPGANGALAAKELAGQAAERAEPDGDQYVAGRRSPRWPYRRTRRSTSTTTRSSPASPRTTTCWCPTPRADSRPSRTSRRRARPSITPPPASAPAASCPGAAVRAAEIPGKGVPFDGGAPALTAVLGNQVDVASIQLGEAMPQIKAGKVTPIVTFAKERNQYMNDVPTATEAGYEVPGQPAAGHRGSQGHPGRGPGHLEGRLRHRVRRTRRTRSSTPASC